MFGYLDFFLEAYPFTLGLFLVLAVLQIVFCHTVKNFWVSVIPSMLFALLFVAVGIPCMASVVDAVPTLILAFAVVMPIQLLLCFKVRWLIIRLIPTILLPLLGIACLIRALTISGWGSLGYLLLMIYIAFIWIIDGVAWGIWGMIKHIRKHRKTAVTE